MVVDDEPPVRRGLRRILQGFGFEVVEAGDGQHALARLREQTTGFDLVILDMVMPGMDGEQTLVALRKEAPGCRVLISSGRTSDEKLRKMLEMGAKGFLHKPYEDWELLDEIERILSAPVSLRPVGAR